MNTQPLPRAKGGTDPVVFRENFEGPLDPNLWQGVHRLEPGFDGQSAWIATNESCRLTVTDRPERSYRLTAQLRKTDFTSRTWVGIKDLNIPSNVYYLNLSSSGVHTVSIDVVSGADGRIAVQFGDPSYPEYDTLVNPAFHLDNVQLQGHENEELVYSQQSGAAHPDVQWGGDFAFPNVPADTAMIRAMKTGTLTLTNLQAATHRVVCWAKRPSVDYPSNFCKLQQLETDRIVSVEIKQRSETVLAEFEVTGDTLTLHIGALRGRAGDEAAKAAVTQVAPANAIQHTFSPTTYLSELYVLQLSNWPELPALPPYPSRPLPTDPTDPLPEPEPTPPITHLTPRYNKAGVTLSGLSVPGYPDGLISHYSILVWARYSGGQISTRPWQRINKGSSYSIPLPTPPAGAGPLLDVQFQLVAYNVSGAASLPASGYR